MFQRFCGPGTKLKKRLARGDRGINPLDEACRTHDIAYSQSNSLPDRHKADWELENRAWERVKSKDARTGEKVAAWAVTTAMKTKRNMGMGLKKRLPCTGGSLSFRKHVLLPILDAVKNSLKDGKGLHTKSDIRKSSMHALKTARAAIKKAGGRRKIRVPRMIPFAKTGGILPLIPIFAGLSALGSIAGGASAIAQTVIRAKDAKKKLDEQKRHNSAMEEIENKGAGLYMKKSSKGGYGLFLKKQKKNSQ